LLIKAFPEKLEEKIMKSTIFCLITVIIFSISLGCTSVELKIKTSHDLEETTWALDTLNGSTVPLQDTKEITLQFDKKNGKIRGVGGCNEYFGNYIKDSDKLNFSNIGSTKMNCSNMLTETDYLGGLPKIDRFEIYDKVLYLYVADKKVMIFHAKD
jgi:heat shock protein HslJ